MKRQVYLAKYLDESAPVADSSTGRVLRGHLTLTDSDKPGAAPSEQWSTSVFARFVPAAGETLLQLVFLHFRVAPIEIDNRTFDLFEGPLIGRFRFIGCFDEEVPELVDGLAELD